jgi:NitT/TauT family transport system substrate-binding protein
MCIRQPVLGAMDPRRLENLQNFYVEEKIVPKAVPLDELYTNRFVD